MDPNSLTSSVNSSQHSSQLVFSELVEVNGLPDESFPISDHLDSDVVDQAFNIVEFRKKSNYNSSLSCYGEQSSSAYLSDQNFESDASGRLSSFSFETVSCNGVSDDDNNQTGGLIAQKNTKPHQYPESYSTHPYEIESNIKVASNKQQVKVFITYANINDDGETPKEMKTISTFLIQNGVDVKIDFMEEMVRTMSVADWLETQLSECDFIMVCINSDYAAIVEDKILNPSGNARQTIYIYRRIHHEFIENQGKNYRFLPMLITDGKPKHVPRWLRDTRLYVWEKDYRDLMYRIYRIPKYQKPKLGTPPVCTIKSIGQ